MHYTRKMKDETKLKRNTLGKVTRGEASEATQEG
jgi:hypothetical protein